MTHPRYLNQKTDGKFSTQIRFSNSIPRDARKQLQTSYTSVEISIDLASLSFTAEVAENSFIYNVSDPVSVLPKYFDLHCPALVPQPEPSRVCAIA